MSVSARVQLTVDVPTGQSWGDDVKASQVTQQAIEAAVRKVKDILHNNNITVVGAARVVIVTAQFDGNGKPL